MQHIIHFLPQPQEYVKQEQLLCHNRYSFHVVTIIPCYREPLELLQPTLIAAATATLPPGCTMEIVLCDDGMVRVGVNYGDDVC